MSSQAPSPSFEASAETSKQPSPAEQLMQLSLGYMPAAALYVASKLNVADLLASGPQPVAMLARARGVNEDALYRTLRFLASFGIFRELGLRYFALTPSSKLLCSDAPDSIRDAIVWLSSPIHDRVFAELMYSVETGIPAIEKVTGKKAFDFFSEHHQVFSEFNAGMTAFSSILIPAVLDVYDFSGIEILVDVAGGHGLVLTAILQRYPEMRGILFEMEQVVPEARQQLGKFGLDTRCEVIAGDFFGEIPAGGDAYIMQHIIHDWDDDRALTILKNVRRALADRQDGKLLVLEDVIEPGDKQTLLKAVDIEMLVMPGGRERTAEEFSRLFTAAGFRLNRIVPTNAPVKVIEGVPV
jgi:hypothetical protein